MSTVPCLFRYKTFLLVILAFFPFWLEAQNGVDNNPCVESISAAERDQLLDIPEGKIIFNNSSGCLNYYSNKKWHIFCEEKDKGQEEQKTGKTEFNESTQELQYELNGLVYTFNLAQGAVEKKATEEVNSEELAVNERSTESTSDLPDDCKIKPTRPYAGKDLVSFDMVELGANKPLHGIAYWQILKGEGGHFVDSTVPSTQFAGVQGVTYHLRWTIATVCDTLFDDALVRIRPPCDPEPSQSFAGSDQYNVVRTTLNANRPINGKGGWTILSGLGGKLSDPQNPKSEFTGIEGETYLLRWIIRNECGLTQDDVIITMKPPCKPNPSIANAGEDQIEIDHCKLHAELPKNGRGKWRVVSGVKGKIFNPDTNITSFFGHPGETYVLQWTVSTKCGSNSDVVKIKFSSYCPSEFTDTRDGKKYKSRRFGEACWMVENLAYRSDAIDAYCYDGFPDFCDQFGALYSWNTLMQGQESEKIQGICPEGWHVPSDKEWQMLADSSGFTGKELQLGGISGFEVPMGGARYTNGKYLNRREYAYYWSSTKKDDKTAWNRYFPLNSPKTDHFPTDKKHSFSVRCVKDD